MTREEAINLLADMDSDKYTAREAVALTMAIKALEQQSCEDCISRQEVNKLVDELARAISDEKCHIQRGRNYGRIMHDILELPSVEYETDEDCISRERVLLEINRIGFDAFTSYDYYSNFYDFVDGLSSEEPERKTGKWVHMVGWWECDQCNAEYTEMPTCMGKVIYEYCPMCGCRMKENGDG
jgi:hypothetical protein